MRRAMPDVCRPVRGLLRCLQRCPRARARGYRMPPRPGAESHEELLSGKVKRQAAGRESAGEGPCQRPCGTEQEQNGEVL